MIVVLLLGWWWITIGIQICTYQVENVTDNSVTTQEFKPQSSVNQRLHSPTAVAKPTVVAQPVSTSQIQM